MIKLCECGCGQLTTIAGYTDARRGYIKGQNTQFIQGHNRRKKLLQLNYGRGPSRLCECGCGGPLEINNKSQFHYKRYIAGHQDYTRHYKGIFYHKYLKRWLVNCRGKKIDVWARVIYQNYYLSGAELPSGSIVHHINRDGCDDRPENLKMTTREEHASGHTAKIVRRIILTRGEEKREFITPQAASEFLGAFSNTISGYLCKGRNTYRGWKIQEHKIKMRKIHFFLHGDTDGIISASILTDFINSQNSSLVIEYNIVNYDEVAWQQRRLPENSVVLDFQYNPTCKVWFDHHESGMGQVKDFSEATKFVRFEPKSPSCARVLFRCLKEKKRSWDSDRWEEAAHWADIIDSANYASAAQVVESKEPALKIRLALSLGGKTKDRLFIDILHQLVEYRGDLDKVAELNRVHWEERNKKIKKAMKAYPVMIKSQNNIGILNLVNTYIPKDRNLPFYLNSNLDYMITLAGWKGDYVLGVGENPWKKPENPINVGKMLEKLGGGGHYSVGGINSRDYAHLFNVALKIFSFLTSRRK